MCPEEVSKEGLEGEALPLEDVEMLEFPEAFEYGLGVLGRGALLSLEFDEKASDLVDAHDSIL